MSPVTQRLARLLAPQASSAGLGAAARHSAPRAGAALASSRAQQRRSYGRRRDPLENDPTAAKHVLEDGSTFIVRPPPSAPSPHSTVADPASTLVDWPASASAEAQQGPLAPPLRPPPSTVPKNSPLSAEAIAEMRALRNQDPVKYSRAALADKFGCSQFFVGIAAPLGKEARARADKLEEVRRSSWGPRKTMLREERRLRRGQW